MHVVEGSSERCTRLDGKVVRHRVLCAARGEREGRSHSGGQSLCCLVVLWTRQRKPAQVDDSRLADCLDPRDESRVDRLLGRGRAHLRGRARAWAGSAMVGCGWFRAVPSSVAMEVGRVGYSVQNRWSLALVNNITEQQQSRPKFYSLIVNQ